MLSLIYFLERNKVAYRKVIPPREAVFKEIKFSNRKLAKYLESKNIKLYSHQVEAIKNILSGK
ncbi:MAG: hypothetical protein DSY60_05920, partial [Persephonella sp.]